MRLQAYLDKFELSVRDFALLACISPATVSRVARGNTPALSVAVKIEKATGSRVRIKDMLNASL